MFEIFNIQSGWRSRLSLCLMIGRASGRHISVLAIAICSVMLAACATEAVRTQGAAVADGRDQASTSLESNQSDSKAIPDICARPGLTPAIAFESGSSELVPCAIRTLDEEIKSLRDHPALKVEVAGHTDSAESSSYSKALSLQRAKVVYDYLLAHGVPSSMLIGPTGFGAERLLYMDVLPNHSVIDQEAAKLNRRVELNVQN